MIVVEVLGRRGETRHRVRLERLPATIGRARSCDVILDDPHVDAVHARLALDDSGAVLLEDAGSLNGTFLDGSAARAGRVTVAGETLVRLGHTRLRLAFADQPVPPAIPDAPPTGRLARLLASPRAMLTVAVIGIGLTMLSVWLGDYDGKGGGAFAGAVAGVALLAVAWAGLWALAGRLVIHRAAFWPHLTLAWLFLVSVGLWSVAEGWLEFLFPAQKLVSWLGIALLSALSVAVISAHAAIASAAPRRRRIALGVGVTAGILALIWLGAKTGQESFGGGVVAIRGTIRPLPAGLVPAGSIEDLLRQTDALKKEIDALEE